MSHSIDVNTRERPHILFVEDDLDFRELVAEELRNHQFEVTELDSLGSTREWMSSATKVPHAVLVDFSLPDGAGTDLVEEMRANDYSEVPVMLLSGEVDISNLAANAGLKHYLLKPPKLAELVKKLNQMV